MTEKVSPINVAYINAGEKKLLAYKVCPKKQYFMTH
jgi:hypothetical protein